MKNLLLASTALVAFAGAAAAEVTVSGQGRFGVLASNGSDTGYILSDDTTGERISFSREDGAVTRFSSRLRVIFGMSFESDSGLTFGGSTRADNAVGANNGTAGSVFVSGDFGKLQVGDVDSAAEAAVGNISGVGYTGVNDYNETFYLLSGGGDPLANNTFSLAARPAALYTYSTGGLSFYLGIGNPAGRAFAADRTFTLSNGTTRVLSNKGQLSQQYSVGVEWANDQFSAGAGYESSKVEFEALKLPDGRVTRPLDETYGAFYLGGSATFAGATFKAMYGDITDLDYTQYGLSVDYTFDAWTGTAFFRNSDYGDRAISVTDPRTGDTASTRLGDRTAYGIGATYDLGGGVLIKGGVVDPDLPNVFWQGDLGVTFNF